MTETYILNTNDQARARLSLQHQLYAHSTGSLIQEAGIKEGMSGLEIGCGSGAMTLELARLVGKDGSLLSIDLSKSQLDYVKNITKNYSTLRFKQWDVNHISDLDEQFDFIYCRLVLHHVADAHFVIKQMSHCLKPGGMILCEEPSLFDSTFCFPPSKAYEQFTQWVRACFAQNKRDFEVAHRLEQEFASCNFDIIHHSLYQPLLRTAQEKLIYSMALHDISPQLLDLQIATPTEIELLSRELINLANSECTMTWIRMHKIIAQLQ